MIPEVNLFHKVTTVLLAEKFNLFPTDPQYHNLRGILWILQKTLRARSARVAENYQEKWLRRIRFFVESFQTRSPSVHLDASEEYKSSFARAPALSVFAVSPTRAKASAKNSYLTQRLNTSNVSFHFSYDFALFKQMCVGCGRNRKILKLNCERRYMCKKMIF